MKKLYIVVRYLGPLKYFEQLIPHLQNDYEVAFLFLEDNGMPQYCRSRGIAFEILPTSIQSARVPFLSHILAHIDFIRRAKEFIQERQPAIILTETSITQSMRVLFMHAGNVGTRVVALQWCPQIKESKATRLSFTNRLRQISERGGGLVRGVARETYFALLTGLFRVLNLTHIVPSVKALGAQKLGVIDGKGRDYFLDDGWKAENITIVGFAPWTSIGKLLDAPGGKTILEEKYALEIGRKRVLLVSTVFYAGHATLCMGREEQVAYFEGLCSDIRGVYPKEEYDLLFKLHPRDEDLYASLEKNGVRLFGNDADLEELLVISDLYIAHPLTAANFLVLATGIPALFINFTSLKILDVGAKLYDLRHIIHERAEFRAHLAEVKAEKLPLQYDPSNVDTASLAKIVSFITNV